MVTFYARLKALKTEGFVPKIPMRIDAGNFLIKTVESAEELETVLQLRWQIFHREFRKDAASQAPGPEGGLDIDEYDFLCDHLVIIEKDTDRLVGTYRLISSSFSDRFYSSGEFVIDRLMAMPGTKLELGRACIDRSFRSGMVITLLWRGLAAYIREVKADYLFGCSSAKTMDPAEVAAIQAYLRDRGYVTDEYGVEPQPAFRMPAPAPGSPAVDPAVAEKLVPSLLGSYLKAGAKVCGEPALDRDFECTDFFTVLRTESLTRMFERKYQVC